jgi:ribosomal protein S18 acetylase RimI-like enzyme
MAEVEIVRAGWQDVPRLIKLDRRCFSAVDAFGWIDFLGLCLWPETIALKAIVGDQLVGFVAGDPRQGYTIIVTLGVDPDWRGQGVGEKLLRECEARSSLPRLQLLVRQSNTAAIGLYRKLQYQIVGELAHYYGDGEDAYVMQKHKD